MSLKLLAFDLDGTLLTNKKRLNPANREAIIDMARNGMHTVFASGRLGSSMMRYASEFDFRIAMLTLNGAVAYTGAVGSSEIIYRSTLSPTFADELVDFGTGQDFACNYYLENELYTVRTIKSRAWIDLYSEQTRTQYNFVDDLAAFAGRSPSKVIFVGAPLKLDKIEAAFRQRWEGKVYICRTWKYYLEFLNLDADKGKALAALTTHLGIGLDEVAAFGDSQNDIPMLTRCGFGIAMANATDEVKQAVKYVSPWTNEQDGISQEWTRLKQELGI
jgi:Cof subfamily protein (haloacid dehalogenase superfamily)